MSTFADRKPLGGPQPDWGLLLQRVAIILGLLALDVGIGLLAAVSSKYPISLIVLALAAALSGLVLIYRSGRFEYGLLTVPLSAGLLDFASLPTGTQSRIVISLVIALALIGAWILQMAVQDRRLQLKPSPINAPLLAFVVISVVAYVWSSVLRDPQVIVPPNYTLVQLGALLVNISLPLLALLVANKVHEVSWLRWLTWIVIGLGALALVSFIFNLPSTALISNGARGVFPTWLGALVCALALFNEKISGWVRLLLVVMLGALLYYYFIMIPDWFSGWLPLGVVVSVVLFMRSKKLSMVSFLILAGFLWFHPDVLSQNVLGRAQNKGDFERLSLWAMNLQLVAQHPLLGMGPAGYSVYNMTYHPSDARSTHNNYFDVLAQTGVVGMAAFLALFGAFLWIGVKNCRALARQRNFEEAFAVATLAGCIGALVAMMLGDWVLPFAYNQTITGFDNAAFTWMLLGAAVSLRRILAARRPVPAALEAPAP